MNLVIVESPTKIKTLEKFLGKDYAFAASYGHIRDLPKKKLGVDVENEFKPEYEIPEKSEKTVKNLRKSVKSADNIYLAMDPDREGEAIAYHVMYILGIKSDGRPGLNGDISGKKYHRVTFNAITKNDVIQAFKHPRKLDFNLFDAQQARRVLDRLVGYKLSPLLWKKIRYGLSAGRVQSVAVRFVIEREREIEKFDSKEYFKILAQLQPQAKSDLVNGQLNKIDNEPIEIKERFKLFAGPYSATRTNIGSKGKADEIIEDLKGSVFLVEDIKKREIIRTPPPPFITSTLQQTASSLLGFSPKRTMKVAQGLYEKGLITYMRTDSFSISNSAIDEIRNRVSRDYSKDYLSKVARRYKTKAKVAQEAHEAIRPTDVSQKLKVKSQKLGSDEKRLFELIYNRTLATQMREAVFDSTTVAIYAKGRSGKKYEFLAFGLTKKFDGYTKILGPKNSQNELPGLKKGEELRLKGLNYEHKSMSPPPRYTESSLIKELEKNGIGRPSTYAPIISTIEGRGYVSKEKGQLQAEDIGMVVNDLLVGNFPEIVDIGFTYKIENSLDAIANGELKWAPVIKNFYDPFSEKVEKAQNNLQKSDIVVLEESKEKCPECGKNLVVKLGKYGKFFSCSGFPDCKYAKPLNDDDGSIDKEQLGKCPDCGGDLNLRSGKFGRFIACTNYPKCKYTRKYLEKTGLSCPDCKKGEVITKRTKRGKMFYGCSRYPECKFASWKRPK